tara:strand:+ start:179 stop:469 length:291 start_codon:yes stop_codon:yes gene_type:complete
MPSIGNIDEFYPRFHEQLKKSQSWPGKYIFKFILKSNHPDFDKLKDFFKKFEKKISIKSSSKKNYKSITISVSFISSHKVISIYRKVSKIDGIIMI